MYRNFIKNRTEVSCTKYLGKTGVNFIRCILVISILGCIYMYYDASFAEEFKYGFDFNVVERGYFKGIKRWTPMDIAYIKMSCPIPGVKYVVPLYEWVTFYGLFAYAVWLLCELYFWDKVDI